MPRSQVRVQLKDSDMPTTIEKEPERGRRDATFRCSGRSEQPRSWRQVEVKAGDPAAICVKAPVARRRCSPA
jgi:hypothetical protein